MKRFFISILFVLTTTQAFSQIRLFNNLEQIYFTEFSEVYTVLDSSYKMKVIDSDWIRFIYDSTNFISILRDSANSNKISLLVYSVTDVEIFKSMIKQVEDKGYSYVNLAKPFKNNLIYSRWHLFITFGKFKEEKTYHVGLSKVLTNFIIKP